MPIPYLIAFAVGLILGIGIAVVLWSACSLSGRTADTEQPLEE